jgi:sensor histidine kinase YesM
MEKYKPIISQKYFKKSILKSIFQILFYFVFSKYFLKVFYFCIFKILSKSILFGILKILFQGILPNTGRTDACDN